MRTIKHETKKLFYKKFLYKLSFKFEVGDIFRTWHQRDGRLSYAHDKILEFKNKLKNQKSFEYRKFGKKLVTHEIVKDAQRIRETLLNSSDYQLRVEAFNLMVYSNSKDELLKIVKNLETVDSIELWEPDSSVTELLANEKDVLVVNKPSDYTHKLTLEASPRKKNVDAFKGWAEANRNKVKITDYSLNTLDSGYWKNFNVYVRDEKVLLLLKMVAPDMIRKVEKIVYKGDVDK
jgi:hypothetical protein